jgi:hypothetical protein
MVAVGFALTSVNAQTRETQRNEGHFSITLVQPSDELTILFNNHHVYSKPEHLRMGRVLAALVRKNTILTPLRGLFEQIGATVSYNSSTKTIDVSKPGSDVQVTVGKPEVMINGKSHPLDVPPEFYKGSLVVPLRVISEAMGAYVQWISERKTVIVRHRIVVEVVPVRPIPVAELPVTIEPAPTPPPVRTSIIGFFNNKANLPVHKPTDPFYGRYSYVLFSKNTSREHAFVASLLGNVVFDNGQIVSVGAPTTIPGDKTLEWNVFFLPVMTTSPLEVDSSNTAIDKLLDAYDYVAAAQMRVDYCDARSHDDRPICKGDFSGPIVMTFVRPLPVNVSAKRYPPAFSYDFSNVPESEFDSQLKVIKGTIEMPKDLQSDQFLPPAMNVTVANGMIALIQAFNVATFGVHCALDVVVDTFGQGQQPAPSCGKN